MDRKENEPHHFKTDDDVSTAVVKAVAFVTGRDPMDIEPLAHIINPDALDDLIGNTEDVTVSFSIEGLEVTVNSSGDIVVTDSRQRESIHEELDGTSNVLLLAGPNANTSCLELRSQASYSDENVLAVQFQPSSVNGIGSPYVSDEEAPANLAVISVGDFVRSTTSTTSNDPPLPFSFETISDPDDLSELEAKISEWLAAWETTDNQTVVCFDSVTDLLQHVEFDDAVECLRSVMDQIRTAGAIAHYHLDATAHDQETIADVVALADAVVETDRNGEWIIRH